MQYDTQKCRGSTVHHPEQFVVFSVVESDMVLGIVEWRKKN